MKGRDILDDQSPRSSDMARIPSPIPCAVILGVAAIWLATPESHFVHARPNDARPVNQGPFSISLEVGGRESIALGHVRSGETYELLVTLEGGSLAVDDPVQVALTGPGADPIAKDLHAGDPDLYLPYRPREDGQARLNLARVGNERAGRVSVRVAWDHVDLSETDRVAIEAEPNESWQQANELRIGRDVYGSGDDVDYLENRAEGKTGLDWFRFDVKDDKPILVYFQLDLLDRDVSPNLRVYTVDARTGAPVPYVTGKDPMEIVHDRERERYSKHISRTFTRGTYYLEVNANHPDYILRTRVLPVPPYDEASQAVEAGMHYIMNVGDAWFAQVPREGNIYVRSANMHDTATRCTACHPSSFSTEANLTAHRNGYEIRSKSNFQYVIDRLYNSITPLYGNEGLFWQRFIGIPLQAQGKQGAILLDFERQVSGKETRTVERFGPFLARAWETRREIPADEQNGVVPLDSKFGIAWRDWRVLHELAARTGRADFARSAASILTIVGDRATDRRIETLQDRIHRLYAWWLLDKTAFAGKIKRETGRLIALQNADGGWHELDSGPGQSAVYTTGQLAWTLLRIGLPRNHPALAKAWRYLLAQQQDFGGWFQTTTHENFRTPMRETRYAVMALAEAFPRGPAPLRGWGNRQNGPARLPRLDSIANTLDDLENLWDVPEPDRARFAENIAGLLEHPSPLVRAAAAAALGRLAQAKSASALASRLGDPSKIVWRAAAWALRRLGNEGKGVDQIKQALDDKDPRLRRGAARVFAYQFHGMDERPELAKRLIELCDDPDLWTRLQALKTLRQWFYRTKDQALSRQIVETYLARMALTDAPVVRKNLSEGLYIMLDENLGGGVSLQKNIEQLPAQTRPRILAARRDFERDVLFTPLMAALREGNDLQVSAVLEAFDGSFFKGRFYARQPEAMIDVGNDREFGFLYHPERQALDSVFARLFKMQLPARARAQALNLAAFFGVLERSEDAGLQMAVLEMLADRDPQVREAAQAIVRTGLDPRGAEADPRRIALLQAALEGSPEGREAVLQAIGKNNRLAASPKILGTIRKLIGRPEAAPSLLPVLRWSVLADADVASLLQGTWTRLTQPQRVQAIDVLVERRDLLDQPEPPEPALYVLRQGLTDSSPAVRERTLAGINSLPRLWSSRVATTLLLSALADDSPALRRQGLALSAKRTSFWSRPDALEHVKRLLVDPDAQVRELALSVVEGNQLLAGARKGNDDTAALARRVKALLADPSLKSRALGLLIANGIDAATLKADVELGRTRLLRFSTFRKNVNPLFYRPGEDRQACANCHGNHTILRIAVVEPAGRDSIQQLMINYNSALKVVNLGEPEASLILRKPRSPHGAGGADATSPTGLTHVGGARWENTESPAYRAILDWIREASRSATGHDLAETYSADSYSPGYEPASAGDGDLSTIWHTEFVGASPGYPHELVVDLGSPRDALGLLYIPRQDSPNGRVKDFEIRTSSDGRSWSNVIASGRWENDTTFKYVPLTGPSARYIQLRGLSEVEGRPFMSAAEISVESRPLGGTE
jgi:cellulose synthase operon protein C